jgi:hypothetical protein
LMRPLLFHASSPSTEPVRRRVIHVDYLQGCRRQSLDTLGEEVQAWSQAANAAQKGVKWLSRS